MQLCELGLVLVPLHLGGDGKGEWCEYVRHKATTAWMGAAEFFSGKKVPYHARLVN